MSAESDAGPGAGARPELEAVVAALSVEFAGSFAPESVAACVHESHELLLPARVARYLPLLAHRFARERLLAASRALEPGADRPPLVLFVCTANSGRSQMAASMLQTMGAGRVEVASAGTAPAEQLLPDVVEVLRELEISAEELFPKPLTEDVVTAADVVVTMGCHDSCPVIPGRRYLDWPVQDPAELDLDGVRAVRDDIAGRVAELLDVLEDGRTTTAAEEPV